MSLLVLVAGTYLVPALSLPQAFLAIVVGSLIGNGMLGVAGLIGADGRVPAMVLMRAPLGRAGSAAPTVLNAAQCVGWAIFELLIIATAVAALSEELFGFRAQWVWTLAFGADGAAGTKLQLAEHPNIMGIKESSGDLVAGVSDETTEEVHMSAERESLHRAVSELPADEREVAGGSFEPPERRGVGEVGRVEEGADVGVGHRVAPRLRLGSCVVDGRKSDFSLYSYKLATYTDEDEFSHTAAEGFIELSSLEMERPGPSYTIDSVAELKRLDPDAQPRG